MSSGTADYVWLYLVASSGDTCIHRWSWHMWKWQCQSNVFPSLPPAWSYPKSLLTRATREVIRKPKDKRSPLPLRKMKYRTVWASVNPVQCAQADRAHSVTCLCKSYICSYHQLSVCANREGFVQVLICMYKRGVANARTEADPREMRWCTCHPLWFPIHPKF